MATTTPTATGGAVLSPCGRYRYLLWRDLQASLTEPGGTCLWVMLNPSTADGATNDPTIRRCMGFTQAWGYERMEVVNLYAYRATQPTRLKRATDPIGPDNFDAIREALGRADLVVAAWGGSTPAGLMSPPSIPALAAQAGLPLHALGTTAKGEPRHPLFMPVGLEPQPWP